MTVAYFLKLVVVKAPGSFTLPPAFIDALAQLLNGDRTEPKNDVGPRVDT
jgi:hypothetical protein